MASNAAKISRAFASAPEKSKPAFRYLSAWFCPFAHRATLALEHHSSRVDYEWVEALGWEQREDKNNVTGTGKEWWYHWKADELKRVNPSALVPTLIPINEDVVLQVKIVLFQKTPMRQLDLVYGQIG